MQYTILGKTGLKAALVSFGGIPIQRADAANTKAVVDKLEEYGINYIDTARGYTVSEELIGQAIEGRRDQFVLATKTPSQTVEGFWDDLHTSLKNLNTDYVDLLQFHNPAVCPRPGDGSGLYEAMLEARAQGKIRFIGLINHRLAVAREAMESGLYDTIQFPFCYLAAPEEIRLVQDCGRENVGFISMKALSGGLITSSAAAYAFQARYSNALPIWGIQRERELDEFLSYIHNPPALTPELQAVIDHDSGELAGDFCRGCGYCLPCPAQIDIPNCARMSLLLRRAPAEGSLTPEWREKMARIDQCLHCGQCAGRCPYGLDTPELLRRNYEDYKTFLK